MPSLLLLAIAAGDAEPKQKARELVSTGNALYAKGEYQGALALYLRAYELHPRAVLLYNIARAAQMSGDLIRAATHYEKFLAESGVKEGSERHTLAIAGLSEIDRSVGKIVVGGAPSRAELLLDGVPAARDIAIRVLPGEHEIVARMAEHVEFRRRATVGAGETSTIEVALVPEPVAPPVPPVSAFVAPPPQEGSIAEEWWFWTVLAAGAVVAAGVTAAVVMTASGFERAGELDTSSTGEWETF